MAVCHPDQKHAGRGLCRSCYDRVRNRSANYGLSDAEFHSMLDECQGRCMICNRADARLVVDHNHKTGIIRGLLCSVCNPQLGVLERRGPEWIEAALEYLRTRP